MIAGLLQFAALYLLAAAMPQHRGPLLGGLQKVVRPRRAGIAGWAVLAVSFGLAIAAGNAIFIVFWLGLLPLSCGLILLGLSFSPRVLYGAILAASLCAAGLLLTQVAP